MNGLCQKIVSIVKSDRFSSALMATIIFLLGVVAFVAVISLLCTLGGLGLAIFAVLIFALVLFIFYKGEVQL